MTILNLDIDQCICDQQPGMHWHVWIGATEYSTEGCDTLEEVAEYAFQCAAKELGVDE